MLGFFNLLFFSLSSAPLPPQAVGLMRALPEGKMPLPFVVEYAIRRSDSYRALKSQLDTITVGEQRIEGLFNPVLKAGVGWQEDRRKPQIIFSPNEIRATRYSLGVGKLFSTGTEALFELEHSTNFIGFSAAPSSQFAETRGLLSVRQNLWKDSFGVSSRAALEASALGSDLSRAKFEEGRQSWYFELAQLYYDSWLAQQQVMASEQSRNRRNRLVSIMQKRSGRGTAERPDLLQVEAALANTKVELARAEQRLQERWQVLVVSLKLPPEIASVDPRLVPLVLDSPQDSLIATCKSKALPQRKSPAVERAMLALKGAKSLLEKAESEDRPDLDLVMKVGANNIAPNSSDTVSEFSSGKYPIYGVGVELTLPLGMDSTQAERRSAAVDMIRAEASQSIEQDSWLLAWQNGCRDLLRLVEAQEILKEALNKQNQREKLEEERFQLGRANTLQVIQAGDDRSASEQSLWATEIQLRLTAWKLEGLNGTLEDRFKKWDSSL